MVVMASDAALAPTRQHSVGVSVDSLLSNNTSMQIIRKTQLLYPLTLLFLFLICFAAHGIVTANAESGPAKSPNAMGPGGKPLPNTPPPRSKRPQKTAFNHTKRLVFAWLTTAQILTFLGNATNIIVHALSDRENGWWCGEATVIYVVGSAFLYALFLISIVDNVSSPNIVHLITWSVALAAELILFGASLALYTSPHEEFNSLKPVHTMQGPATQWEIVELVCDGARILFLVLCIVLYVVFSKQRLSPSPLGSPRSSSPGTHTPTTERTPLLNGHAHGPSHGTPTTEADGTAVRDGSTNGSVLPAEEVPAEGMNGSASNLPGGPKAPADTAAFYRPKTAEARSWWEYLRGYSLFFPYLWPSSSVTLQATVVGCFAIVLVQRFVNLLVPYQIGVVTDRLAQSQESGRPDMPWLQISLLVGFKFLQGSSGILGAVRSFLWIPVSQYSYAALTNASFEHVHGLSLEFHLGKRTGEVLSAMSKGDSINKFLEQVTFQVLPMLIDLGVAMVYFSYAFDYYYTLTVGILTFWYLYLTIRLAQWRAEARRAMTNASRELAAVQNDSILSYETVKYFGAEDYEFDRFRETIQVYQKSEYTVTLSLQIMNITQNMLFMLGLLVVAFIAAYQVTTGLRQVGQFVLLITYMAQLQSPLNFFGTFYRSVQSSMISGERLLELFKEQPSVVDKPGAMNLPYCDGEIDFENVKFSYDQRKPALEGLNFKCPAGTTTALVGESGGGKSTVFRLLYRFYNLQDGSIKVDGLDVRDVTIKALRSHIGVVPQDTILFNETLMYNLRYANQDAMDEEIYAACRAASIHDKIMTFPDKYETKVGERGLRLSGGEKQRVAIARTILKNPRIIMLDEATAALDSETEQNIQEALSTLSKGRTMLVIAHRLSTITGADQILVLHQGRVVESGTHEELLAKEGRYAAMWKKQIRYEQAAREAQVLSDRATKLKEESFREAARNSHHGSEDASDDDHDFTDGVHSRNHSSANLTTRTLRGLADGLRGTANMMRSGQSSNERHDLLPPGHP